MHETLQARWSEIGDKIIQLAHEFPEDAFDTTPVPGTRSFGDQLRHVAFWNEYAGRTLLHESPDGSANELPRSTTPTKAKVVEALRASFDGVRAALASRNGTADAAALDTMVAFIEHGGEHYGQLVLYYRLNGLVPPASR